MAAMIIKGPPLLKEGMNYNELKNKACEFLAATGLKRDEFEKLLPVFRAAYVKKYSSDRTEALCCNTSAFP
jgi:hypothetical protein